MTKFTEREILIEAIKVVNEYGQLTTSELIEVLREVMKPDGHDINIIKGRNDDYFSQKVRNLKSHNSIERFVDIHKLSRNTLYISRKFKEETSEISNEEKKQVIKEKSGRMRTFRARRVEFDKINSENQEIGIMGETFVYELEKATLNRINSSSLEYLEHTSKIKGDGTGYDILSYDEDNNLRYIEVKTTKGKLETPFFMSINEYDFYKYHIDNYILARVYNFNKETQKGDVKYYKGSTIETTFDFHTSLYKVTFK